MLRFPSRGPITDYVTKIRNDINELYTTSQRNKVKTKGISRM